MSYSEQHIHILNRPHDLNIAKQNGLLYCTYYMEDLHLSPFRAQLMLTGRQIKVPHLYLIDARLFEGGICPSSGMIDSD